MAASITAGGIGFLDDKEIQRVCECWCRDAGHPQPRYAVLTRSEFDDYIRNGRLWACPH
jgi:hypothetical protein